MAPMVLPTIFHRKHLARGAKMMDFGGWDMPIHYGSQLGEHLQTRNNVSLFDVSHMAILDCFGASSKDFLSLVLANNIAKLDEVGKGFYSCMLNSHGGIIDDLIVYRLDDRYRLVINASTAVADIAWLKSHALNFPDLTLVPRRSDIEHSLKPESLIALQGPKSEMVLRQLFPAIALEISAIKYFHVRFLNTPFGELMFARTGYTGEDGFEISVPASNAEAFWDLLTSNQVLPAGLGARDTLRIEAGYNLYGQDMNAQTSPLDSGLAWTVDLKSPRNFIGKQALVEQGQTYDFLGLVLLSKGVLRAHQKVLTPLGEGEICSGTYSPSLEKSIALARLPKGQILGSQVQVIIRDQVLDAKLVKPQFVRRGQILI
jgi:aminomethyltransferase